MLGVLTPWWLFVYMCAAAGGLMVIGLVVVCMICVFLWLVGHEGAEPAEGAAKRAD